MHLLLATPGMVSDGTEAVRIAQRPGEMVLLSAADTELAAWAAARRSKGAGFPDVRVMNLLQLAHPATIDFYVDDVVRHAKVVIARLIGGAGYWTYGVDRLVEICATHGIALALLPGEERPDPELTRRSTIPAAVAERLWRYCVEGGPGNAATFLDQAAALIGAAAEPEPPRPLLKAGLYWPDITEPSLAEIRQRWSGGGIVPIVFYRALVHASDLAPVDRLISALRERGLDPLPIFVASLKDAFSAALLRELMAAAPPSIILNLTAFAVAGPGSPFEGIDRPVLQVILAGGTEESWAASQKGLSPSDLAMNIALPEVDGRIVTRAVSFKGTEEFDPLVEYAVRRHRPVADRIDFVADLAANWVRLAQTPTDQRRVAVILAEYPPEEGRIGNGVGLDTPAGTVSVLRAMEATGYAIDPPLDGAELVRRIEESRDLAIPLGRYRAWFGGLSAGVRGAVTDRWGEPELDPAFDGSVFRFKSARFGGAIVAAQPPRGLPGDDLVAAHHDVTLPPPHSYLAFYLGVREEFSAHAVIHMGKHGTLEWLPGKAVALSKDCLPELALGPLPHIYPFIVNDPGEGSQAKRRAQAVIVDHLMPPLTRAESYGPLAELERLVDEYYAAVGLDPRRLATLAVQIRDKARDLGLDRDCGVDGDDAPEAALVKIDSWLCQLKDMQLRDGLHVFGQSPTGEARDRLILAFVRLPRGGREAKDASILRALSSDLELDGFDPLAIEPARPWTGPRPSVLAGLDEAWRSEADTVDRLEALALELIAGRRRADPAWTATGAVLDEVAGVIHPAVEQSGPAEIAGVLTALDGRFVRPGPSGAPSRGRLDVLPTGKNFFAVDCRAVPTPTCWSLGWRAAEALVERHRQAEGEWPRAVAISAWGTSAMRTGGDDLAQAMALIGVRPCWDGPTNRLTGFEVLPLSVLDRPRVDVTLRVSGFFRDAFPAQIDLFDSAVRAVAALDEPEGANPIARAVLREFDELVKGGMDEARARRLAGLRVFSSAPGAYGAGLDALSRGGIDGGRAEAAARYIKASGFAYGGGASGEAAHSVLESRLAATDAVVQNQDNREHDVLDSDGYAEFAGGLTAAVESVRGSAPRAWHGDTSRPERPVIRAFAQEIARVVRGRAVNPKWIRGVMRHGYRGAAEIAATVDYLVAFATVAPFVADHHFDAVHDAYLRDEEVRRFLLDSNPDAARSIARRLLSALDRGLWKPRANDVHERLTTLAQGRDAA